MIIGVEIFEILRCSLILNEIISFLNLEFVEMCVFTKTLTQVKYIGNLLFLIITINDS